MTKPEIETPGDEPAQVERQITLKLSATPASSGDTALSRESRRAQAFIPTRHQEQWLAEFLEESPDDMDPEDVATRLGMQDRYPNWLLQPGFSEWVSRHVTARMKMDIVIAKAKIARAASTGDLDAQKLMVRVFPQVVEPQEAKATDFEMTATEKLIEARKKITERREKKEENDER